MPVDKDQIRTAVYTAIAPALQRGGHSVPTFKDTDEPVSVDSDLDSQTALEVILELEELLEVEDLGTDIFVKDKGKSSKARTISEIVEYIFQKLRKLGKA